MPTRATTRPLRAGAVTLAADALALWPAAALAWAQPRDRRYALVVTARGSSGPVAVQRLPLALVRPLR